MFLAFPIRALRSAPSNSRPPIRALQFPLHFELSKGEISSDTSPLALPLFYFYWEHLLVISSRLQLAGILLLVALGLSRPLIFLLRPPYAYEIMQNRLLFMISPVPLVFDKPEFFTDHSMKITLSGPSGETDGNFPRIRLEQAWSPWHQAHLHMFYHFGFKMGELNERDLALVRKLFCEPRFYHLNAGDFTAITISMKIKNQELRANVTCPSS